MGVAGGPPFGFGFLSNNTTVGAPSLRFLQGWAAMLPMPSSANARDVKAQVSWATRLPPTLREKHAKDGAPGGWATLTGEYSAGLSLNIDRNNWGYATSRAFREVACRTADTVRLRFTRVPHVSRFSRRGMPRTFPPLQSDTRPFSSQTICVPHHRLRTRRAR